MEGEEAREEMDRRQSRRSSTKKAGEWKTVFDLAAPAEQGDHGSESASKAMTASALTSSKQVKRASAPAVPHDTDNHNNIDNTRVVSRHASMPKLFAKSDSFRTIEGIPEADDQANGQDNGEADVQTPAGKATTRRMTKGRSLRKFSLASPRPNPLEFEGFPPITTPPTSATAGPLADRRRRRLSNASTSSAATGAGDAASVGSASRRNSMVVEFEGCPPMSPSISSSGPSTPLSNYSGQRRKLSNKIKGRFSLFEHGSNHGTSNHNKNNSSHHNRDNNGETIPLGALSPRNSFCNDEDASTGHPTSPSKPSSSSSLSALSPLSQRAAKAAARKAKKRDSKASQLIQQFDSPQKTMLSDSDHLLSPKEISDLIKSSTITPLRVSQYLSNSPGGSGSSKSGKKKKESTKANGSRYDQSSTVPLLTPKEVRALIKATSKNLAKFVETYEPKNKTTKDTTKPSTTAKEAKKDAKRRHRSKNKSNQQEDEKAKEETEKRKKKKKKKKLSTSTGVEAFNGALQQDDNAVFEKVEAIRHDFTDFQAPTFYTLSPSSGQTKTPVQCNLIETTVESNFVFSKFRSRMGKSQKIQSLIGAFEPVVVPKGATILEQGNEQDHFYIIEQGQLDFKVDGKVVGTANAGDCFGEQSLLYQAPSYATVVASATEDAKLLRLDQRTYRGILQTHAAQEALVKREIIATIDFLQPILEQDATLVEKLASLLERADFVKGQKWNADEDDTFHIVHEGTLQVDCPSEDFHLDLDKGMHFGKRALLNTHRICGGKTTISASSENGIVYTLDRDTVETSLGSSRLEQLQILSKFSKGTKHKSLKKVKGESKRHLAKSIKRKRYKKAGHNILEEETPDKPALYVVEEGAAKVTYTDHKGTVQEKTVQAGDVFGDEHIHGEEETDNSSAPPARKTGFKAETVGDVPTAVGILPFQDIETAEKKEDLVPSPQKVGKGVVSFGLDKKIRQSVRANIGLNDLEKISLLGEGQFGEVWLVSVDVFQTGVESLKQKFALKSQLKKDDIRDKQAIDAIRREIDVMENLQHPGIVNLVNTYEDETSIYMLMGLISGGELWSLVHKEDSDGNWTSGIPEANAQFYILAVADTLAFMHRCHYIFRDLKPENIMIGDDGYPVIVDFGFAKHCPDDRTYTFCGTPNYVAPEVITNSGHGSAVDYWALGITLFELITGENPFWFEGMDQVSLYDAICSEEPYAYKEDKSDELKDLTNQLLVKDPARRLGSLSGGFEDLVEHSFFKSLKLEDVRAKTWPAPWKPHGEDEDLDEDVVEDLMASFSNLALPSDYNTNSQPGETNVFDEIQEDEENEDDNAAEPLSIENDAAVDDDNDKNDNNDDKAEGTLDPNLGSLSVGDIDVNVPDNQVPELEATEEEHEHEHDTHSSGSTMGVADSKSHDDVDPAYASPAPGIVGRRTLLKLDSQRKTELELDETMEVKSVKKTETSQDLDDEDERSQWDSEDFLSPANRKPNSQRFDPTGTPTSSIKTPSPLLSRRGGLRRGRSVRDRAGKNERRSTIKDALADLGLDDMGDMP